MKISINFVLIREKDEEKSLQTFIEDLSISAFSKCFRKLGDNLRFIYKSNTQIDSLLRDPLNTQDFTQNSLPVYVISSKIPYPDPVPEIQIEYTPHEEEIEENIEENIEEKVEEEVKIEEKPYKKEKEVKVSGKKPKDKYDMKNKDDVSKLFAKYNLNKDDLREFCDTALNRGVKAVESIKKFDDVLENPFTAMLVDDKEMMGNLMKD